MAKRPPKRTDVPPRSSDNVKRALIEQPDPSHLAALRSTIHYAGHPKHKRNPHLYGLGNFNGQRGDETLCDEHGGFTKKDMPLIPSLLQRGIDAELVGERMVWTVADDGWIFEARLTNRDTNEYHGYPVRPSEAISELVYKRFAIWAVAHGSALDQMAMSNCAQRYGIR